MAKIFILWFIIEVANTRLKLPFLIIAIGNKLDAKMPGAPPAAGGSSY
jgi:hypothetical protein